MGVWIETTATIRLCHAVLVTPCVGVWIETEYSTFTIYEPKEVTPCVGVWIETSATFTNLTSATVTPCVGVWIETLINDYYAAQLGSHPAWVCGLKLFERNTA